MCKEYNGWTNYETWCVNLWIDNDEGLYNYFTDRAEEILETSNYPYATMRDELKDYIEEYNPINTADLYSDLLSAAIEQVDFYEIATHYIDTAKERVEE